MSSRNDSLLWKWKHFGGWLWLWWLGITGLGYGHHGFDAHVSVCMEAGKTRVVCAMSPSIINSHDGVMVAGWAGVVTEGNRAALERVARGMFELKQGGRVMEVVGVRVVTEASRELAVTLEYGEVKERPFSVEAVFCRGIRPEFMGHIRLFDRPAGPAEHQGRELARIELSARDRVLSWEGRK